MLKIKFANFQSTTVESSVAGTIRLSLFKTLCQQAYQRQALPVRLLGVGVRFDIRGHLPEQQLDLFAEQ